MKKIGQIWTLILIVFLDFIGFGMAIPIGPLLLTNPNSAGYILPAGTPAATGYILFGLILAMFPLGQFLVAPILGQLSDKFGRKPILALTLIGTMLAYALFGLGIYLRSIPLLFIARFTDGITGSNIPVVYAAMADITAAEERSRRFSLVGAAIGLGLTMGPFLGGFLSDSSRVSWFTFATPFWLASGLSLVAVLLVFAVLSETLVTKVNQGKVVFYQSIINIGKALRLPGLRSILSTSLLYNLGFTFYQTFIGVFLLHKFNLSAQQIGDFFLYTGVWLLISQLFVVRRLAKYFSERQILRFSLILTGICPLLYLLPSTVWGIMLVTPFFVIFNSLTVVNIPALVSRSADKTVQGEVLGINSSVQALAQTIPPIIAGLLAASVVFWTPLLACGLIVILAGIVFLVFYKNPDLKHA